MPVICGIVGCSNRSNRERDVRYFKVPKVILGQGEETKKLSEERRRLWKAAIRRKDITSEEKWDRTRVCSKHFVGGENAYLHDRNSPSWLPTIALGHSSTKPEPSNARYHRAKQREGKRKVSDAISSLLTLKNPRLAAANIIHEHDSAMISHASQITDSLEAPEEPVFTTCERGTQTDSFISTSEAGTQTELTSEYIAKIENDNKARVLEASAFKKHAFSREGLYSFSAFENDDKKVSFYTGLPDLETLKVAFDLIEYQMSNSSKCLSKENQFMLCMIKLRLNYCFQDIAYQLNVSLSTVQKCFHSVLDLLYIRLSFFVKWPERESLRISMQMSFRKEFGTKVAVILDCFELKIEKPSAPLSKVYTYSNYKHYHSVKYLIGIAPQGVITFISEGWGGRTSDKHITEESGILENLLPGDIVMVDRGFTIEESVNFYQAELAIPAFTKGKSQLHPMDVEGTRKIANVRIHVERVIGLVCRKFGILDGTIPIDFLKLRNGETVPTIDKIVHVCCFLTNLCPSVVPFD
ncbi:uncharacterized protein LOC106165380 [Lingula anatina]|uniref:Uncharacterized protein LOC106165380 n=1 Tax=Lingula anatina TaxID=7574 RepID=A0A1S3INC5_LINAN|nr:uncharacterized protein LOC106165380 [Lingula anatina]|eukprot:XP_013399039.1 uncharacterized protein LOC106165380 [Lingula anatina]